MPVLEKLNLKFETIEGKIGRMLFSLVVGVVLLGVAMLYVMPKFKVAFHGLQFALLSNDPFDFSLPNPVRYRILAPLLGYLTFLRGNRFVLLPLFFAMILLSSVYGSFRGKGFRPLEAMLVAGTLAFSAPILLQLIGPGYTDAVFYCFIFLSFHFVRRAYLSGFFFALALLTHESSLFLLPALLMYSAYLQPNEGRKWMRYVLILAIATLPLMLFRYWISHYVEVPYGLGFYFSAENIQFTWERVVPRFPLGLFFVFKLFWLIPMYVIWKSIQQKDFRFAGLLLCILACDIAQLFIAYDVTRMLCLGFPTMLLAAERMKEYVPQHRYALFMMALIAANFLIPQYFMTCDGLVYMPPFFLQ